MNFCRGRYKAVAWLFGAIVCFGGGGSLSAQTTSGSFRTPFGTIENPQTQMQYGAQSGVVDHNAQEQPADTTKQEPKIRKPLESYFFGDSLRARLNFAWSPKMDVNEVKYIDIDTSLNGFQNDYPFLQYGVGAIYTGNVGGPSMPLDYYNRPDYRNFAFAQVVDDYLFTPERVRFFNVKKAFTHFSYSMSGQAKRFEEGFRITHAQNISPSSGFNIDYRTWGMRGIYTNHKTRDKNLSMAFSHTGKKYTLQAGYIYNMVRLNENGGITEDRSIRDTVFEMPEVIPVNLQSARNLLKNNTWYLFQSYGIPLRKLTEEDFSIADRSSFFIGHSMEYSRFSRNYTDTKSSSGDYFQHWYIDPTQTRDSTYERLFSNKVFVQIQPWDREGAVGVINAGIGYDMHLYSQFQPEDYLTQASAAKRNDTYVYGSLRGKVSRYVDWDAHMKYHPFGDFSQDMTLGGDIAMRLFIRQRPLTLSGSVTYERRTPNYWMQRYFSNHFVWSNSFSKETETRFMVKLSAPIIGLELGATNSMTRNKIYFGSDMVPMQYNGTVNVLGLYGQKDFRLGGLHLNHRVLLQYSNAEEVVSVPLAGVYLSYYYEFNVVKNVLRMQIGIDGRYNTKYNGYGYNPAIMQFYTYQLQGDDRQIGGYPMLDFFVTAKWKRMRILAKLQHLNDDLFGERNYFSVQHYPLNKRMFRLGISWTFYD